MSNRLFVYEGITDELVKDIANGDAALWVGPDLDKTDTEINLLEQLIQMPWKVVLCESPSSRLIHALENDFRPASQFYQSQGFLHLVCADPENLELPRRAQPVFMLNGRQDSKDLAESSALRGNAALRRRLNMINMLNIAKPKHLVVLSTGRDKPLNDTFALWEEEFRSLLSVISTDPNDKERITLWLNEVAALKVAGFYSIPFELFVHDLLSRLIIEIPEEKVIIRLRRSPTETVELDITDCELIEHPVFDRYESIQIQHLRRLSPEDLSEEDFTGFFDKSKQKWTAYAARLPWDKPR